MFDEKKLNKLYQFALSLCNNEQIAFDLVHDIVEKLLDETFIFNKVAYAKKAIRHKYYDMLKSKAYTQSDIFEDDIPAIGDIENNLDNKLQLDIVLEKLSDQDREILYLWAVEEYTTQEISKLTGIAKGTITSKLKRLRDKLQKGVTNE
jgi:RNA polymerase sigma-70 factor (ECF subfamily)